MAKGAKTGGRQPGSLNKATVEFRQTVQKVLEENASNVGKWLAMVAEGVPATEPGGKGVEPDPGKALDLMAKLAEYAAPKLARTEHTGADGGAIDHSLTVQFVGQKS
jgi:hypothetical protein